MSNNFKASEDTVGFIYLHFMICTQFIKEKLLSHMCFQKEILRIELDLFNEHETRV